KLPFSGRFSARKYLHGEKSPPIGTLEASRLEHAANRPLFGTVVGRHGQRARPRHGTPPRTCGSGSNPAYESRRGSERRAVSGKGVGRVPRARLCAGEKRSSAGARAKRASTSYSPRLSERSARKRAQRITRRQPALRASQGTPAKRGLRTRAPAARGPLLCPHRPFARQRTARQRTARSPPQR